MKYITISPSDINSNKHNKSSIQLIPKKSKYKIQVNRKQSVQKKYIQLGWVILYLLGLLHVFLKYKNLINQEMLLLREFRNCVTHKNELCELIESFLKNAVFGNEKHILYKP